ncbi:VTC domain-containing protein [Sporodiniella umbellata]|nr:VTC domain-containing protein [Sporodiniella umbellata]
MKFGQQLQKEIFPPWKLSYISYDVLKNDLKSRQNDHGWNQQDEEAFIKKLNNELDKVYDFVTAKLSEVEARISYCERTIQTFVNNPSWSSEQNWSIMEDALTEVLFDVNDLAKFTRLNYIGFQKIIKKHDKHTGLDLQQVFIPRLRSKPLDKQRFDVALVFISALHDLCKQRGRVRTSMVANPLDGPGLDDKTSKYWVHPDNITEVKSIIMLHLPVFIQNPEKRFEPSDAAFSHVYLDNPDFGLYTSVLQRDDDAESLCFHWQGSFASPTVFAEHTTLKAAWLNGAPAKDHLAFDPDEVSSFLSGELTAQAYSHRRRTQGADAEAVDKMQRVASGIQKALKAKQLAPVCRVFYQRTRFQLPDDDQVQVKIDNDVAFIREDNLFRARRRGPNEWRRPDVDIDYPFSYLHESEVLRFPYAVLEAKGSPDWLKNLLESHLVHEVPRFSKYLHGIAYLFRDRLPLLPWWLSEMEVDIRKPRATDFGLSRSKSFKPMVDGQYRRIMATEDLRMNIVSEQDENNKKVLLDRSKSINDWDNRPHRMQSTLVHKGDDPLNYGPLKRTAPKEDGPLGEAIVFSRGDIRLDMNDKRLFESSGMYVKDPNDPNSVIPVKKVKVEPKVFFSNERTFISWLQFCALLLSVALNLLNFGDKVSRIAGALFIGISAGVAIYALYQFERRAWMINRRIVGRYDDLWGPAVLCVLLVGALVVNFYLRFH